jgi:hypothetical protein
MTLIDAGIDNGMCFGHVDYNSGEGRPISYSKNALELNINPELTPDERRKISSCDNNRRNQYGVSLFCERNTQIIGYIHYNPISEALSLSCHITAQNGKKLLRCGYKSVKNPYGRCQTNISLLCENNCCVVEKVSYNPITEALSFSSTIEVCSGKKLFRAEEN